MEKSVFDETLEEELDLIVRYTVHIRNSINGIKTKQLPENIAYADVLGQKIFSHILTSRDLLGGYQSELTKTILQKRTDYSSVYILLRSALETFLTFNHIFISAKSIEESIFRFNCWSLSSYTDKERFIPTSEESIRFMESESIEMNKLQLIIEGSEIYQQLSKGEQKSVLKGKWQMQNGWVDLACTAGYSRNYVGKQYSYLSGHAHANKTSIHHINANRRFNDGAADLNFSYSVMLSVLCKFNYDFICLVPHLQHIINEEDAGFRIILKWKNIIAQMNEDS